MRDPRIKCVQYCIKPGGLIKAAGLIKAGGKNNNLVQSATSLKLQRPKPKKFGLHTGNNFQMFKINQRSRDMIWNENFHKIKNTRLTNLVWTKREPRICVACVQWLMFARRRAGATQKGRELQTGLRDGCHFSFLSFEKTNQTHGYIMDTFVSHTWKRHEVQTGSRNLFSFPFGANVLNFFLSGANVRKLCSVRNLLQYTLQPQVTPTSNIQHFFFLNKSTQG